MFSSMFMLLSYLLVAVSLYSSNLSEFPAFSLTRTGYQTGSKYSESLILWWWIMILICASDSYMSVGILICCAKPLRTWYHTYIYSFVTYWCTYRLHLSTLTYKVEMEDKFSSSPVHNFNFNVTMQHKHNFWFFNCDSQLAGSRAQISVPDSRSISKCRKNLPLGSKFK